MEFNLQTLIAFIDETGFPIAACVALFWLVNNTLKQNKEILDELKIAIQNNTKAIEELSSKHKEN